MIGADRVLLATAAPASTPVFMVMSLRFGGVGFLALGVIAWLVRNAEASKTRDALVLGYTLVFALMAVVSLHGYALPGHSIFWVTASTQALVAVGFFVAGRSSMSAQTS